MPCIILYKTKGGGNSPLDKCVVSIACDIDALGPCALAHVALLVWELLQGDGRQSQALPTCLRIACSMLPQRAAVETALPHIPCYMLL